MILSSQIREYVALTHCSFTVNQADVENRKAWVMNQYGKLASCRFCFVSDSEHVLSTGSNLYTMFSVGPLAPGHTMLLTNDHYSCAAEVSDAIAKNMEDVRQRLESEFRGRFGGVTMFEHGRAGVCSPPGHGHDHCYHSHLHFVPLGLDLISIVRKELEVHEYDDWMAYRRSYLSSPEPYLSIWSGDRFAVVRDPATLPHHFLRTRIAGELGEALLGDWAAFPREDIVRESMSAPQFQFLKEMDLDEGN